MIRLKDQEAQALKAKEFQAYLNAYVQMTDGQPSVYKLVAERGRFMPFDRASFQGKRAKAKECFSNAGRLAIDDPSRFHYCEGYITTWSVPIHHAWVLDLSTNLIIDPTLVPSGRLDCYFGVSMPAKTLMTITARTGYWGLLDPMNNPRWQEVGA